MTGLEGIYNFEYKLTSSSENPHLKKMPKIFIKMGQWVDGVVSVDCLRLISGSLMERTSANHGNSHDAA